MCRIPDKDTIKTEIIPHLPTAQRSYKTKSDMVEIVTGILYKLKTGCHRHLLPVEGLFTEEVLSYQVINKRNAVNRFIFREPFSPIVVLTPFWNNKETFRKFL